MLTEVWSTGTADLRFVGGKKRNHCTVFFLFASQMS